MTEDKTINYIDVSLVTEADDTHVISTKFHTEFCNLHIKTLSFEGSDIYINGEKNIFAIGRGQRFALKVIFTDCKFDNIIFTEDFSINIVFDACTIDNFLLEDIQEVESKKYQYSTIIGEGCAVNRLTVFNSYVNGNFYINPQSSSTNKSINTIGCIDMTNSTFKDNFKLHNTRVDAIEIDNIDFKKNADFFKTQFSQNVPIVFKAVNFSALALFGECLFESKFILEYVTFKGLGHFKKATFKNGVDLENTNIEKELNFYGVEGLDSENSMKETSQESYRIVKYNFHKVGNTMEANLYHSLELEKRKEFLYKEKSSHFYDWVIFQLNWATSRFSRSWIRVLFYIGLVGILTIFCLYFSLFKDLSFYLSHFRIEYIEKGFSAFFKYVSIFNMDKNFYKAHPVIFFLNKIALGYLYYQFIVAVRKDTKR